MSYAFSEHLRQTNNSLRLATVAQIDWEQRRFRAESGGIKTNWLEMPAVISRNFRGWLPLREGMQVVLSVDGGDYNTAVVVGALWSEDVPAPDIPTDKRPDVDQIVFNDGAKIEYDSQTKTLTIKADHIKFEGQTMTHNDRNIGHDHRHGGVRNGGGQTGGPN